MNPPIFISYCHSDWRYVERLCNKLDEAGINYYIDRNRITWGSPVTDEVLKALYECVALVVIVSKASNMSQWVPFEIGHVFGCRAMGAKKKILPLLTNKTLPLPLYLSNFKRLASTDEAVKYFRSDEWGRHILESKDWKSMELNRIKREYVIKLEELEAQERDVELLKQYTSGAKEPEEL